MESEKCMLKYFIMKQFNYRISIKRDMLICHSCQTDGIFTKVEGEIVI